MRSGTGFLTIGLVLTALLVASMAAQSFSSGIDRAPGGLTDEGCICHGPNGADDGVANANVVILFDLDLGFKYEPGEAYNLTVGIRSADVPPADEGNKGGFNLLASLGTLEPGEGFEDFVQVNEGPDAAPNGAEALHTAAGDRNGRTFNLTWTAPGSDDGPAVFTLFVNAVNGDALNSEGDHWNGAVFIVPGPSGEIAAGGAQENPVEIGVRWFAHWIGVISFAAVVVTLVIYYFVLKYGESIHTTDHRDRQGK
jgi:hypothetical protein